jgi:hypothetical protein
MDSGLARETALLLQIETLRQRLLLRSAAEADAASRLAAAEERIAELMEAVRSLREGLTVAQRLAGKLGRALEEIASRQPSLEARAIADTTLRWLSEQELRIVKAGES